MKEHYFLSKDNKKEGPYTLDEVLAMRLTDDTLVWKDGISWSKVSELLELEQAVIKTPPPLPHEIQSKKDKENNAHTNALKKKAAWNIIGYSLLIGAVVAGILSCLLAEYAESGGTNEYPIFHAPGDETWSDFFWKVFFPLILLITELLALMIAGVKIAFLKPKILNGNNQPTDDPIKNNNLITDIWIGICRALGIIAKLLKKI